MRITFASCSAFLAPLFFFYASISFFFFCVNNLDCMLLLSNIYPFLPIFLISMTRASGVQQALENFPWGNGMNAGIKAVNSVALVILIRYYLFLSLSLFPKCFNKGTKKCNYVTHARILSFSLFE